MAIEFYDNADEPLPSDPSGRLVVVDRVYGLDWSAFEDRHWEALGTIYASLPGWRQVPDRQAWFGSDDGAGAHLEASLEPPGLHVTGILESGTFLAWDTAFRNRADHLPAYDPR